MGQKFSIGHQKKGRKKVFFPVKIFAAFSIQISSSISLWYDLYLFFESIPSKTHSENLYMEETGVYVIMVSFLLFRQPASCVPGPLQPAADIYWWEFCLPANSSGSRRVSCAIHLGGWATGCQALSCWPSPLESGFRRNADLWIHCVRWVQCTEQILYWGKGKNTRKEKQNKPVCHVNAIVQLSS